MGDGIRDYQNDENIDISSKIDDPPDFGQKIKCRNWSNFEYFIFPEKSLDFSVDLPSFKSFG